MTMNTPYTTQELSVLVEEYITQQRARFTLCGLYAYIAYWGMEESRIAGHQLSADVRQTVSQILQRIVRDGRIRGEGDEYEKVGS
jgi:hypothetical protein